MRQGQNKVSVDAGVRSGHEVCAREGTSPDLCFPMDKSQRKTIQLQDSWSPVRKCKLTRYKEPSYF